MNNDRKQPVDSDLPDVTDAFGEDLRSVFKPSSSVPPQIDQRIASAVRLAQAERRRRRFIRVAASVTAAAAAIALVVTFTSPFKPSDQTQQAPAPMMEATVKADPYDVDGSGRVDILDAYVLARRLERPHDADPVKHNAGTDGYTSKDIDAIVQAAVRIDGG